MAAVKSDNPQDIELVKEKIRLTALITRMNTFMISYATLLPKERAITLKQIQNASKEAGYFIDRFPIHLITNAGSKFAFENMKQTYQTNLVRWRKFESTL